MTDPTDNGAAATQTELLHLAYDEVAHELAEATLRDEVLLGIDETLRGSDEERKGFIELADELGPEKIDAWLRDSQGKETPASRYFAAAATLARDGDRSFTIRAIDRNTRSREQDLTDYTEKIAARRNHRYGERSELAGLDLIKSALVGLRRAKIVNEAVQSGSALTPQPWVVEAHARIGQHAAAVAHVPNDVPHMPIDGLPERSVERAGVSAAVAGGVLGLAEVLPPSIAAFVRALAGIAGGLAVFGASRAVNQFSERNARNRAILQRWEGADHAQADARDARDEMSRALLVQHRPLSATRPSDRGGRRR